MDRRSFLSLQPEAKKPALHAARTNTGLSKYTGAWTANEVQHLLKRTLFGSTKADIDMFTSLGLAASVNQLINYTSPLPAPPLNDYNSATITDPAVAPGATWVNNPTNDGTRSRISGKR
jgi:hypothetical protein